MNFAVNGVSGRMGRTIYRLMHERSHSLHCGFEASAAPFIGKDAGLLIGLNDTGRIITTMNSDALKGADAVIDFTVPAVTFTLLEIAEKSGTPIVIGTTGIDDAGKKRIQEASKKIPVFYTPNMSFGVNLLFKIVEYASKILPEGYDIEISEAHHKMKKDAPSGTALKLFDIVKENSPHHSDAHTVCAREGFPGERTQNEIGMQVLRGGDIVGEHTVYLVGMGERIELTHRAMSRDQFANGAVRAAEFIAGKKPGLYTFEDLLAQG